VERTLLREGNVHSAKDCWPCWSRWWHAIAARSCRAPSERMRPSPTRRCMSSWKPKATGMPSVCRPMTCCSGKSSRC
jgi:hypothetical protein